MTGDEAEARDDDIVGQAIAAGSPAVDDIVAKLTRARVAAALFGAKTSLRIGRYELEKQLGAGGGGVVFVARDPELSRRVALKLLTARGAEAQLLAEAHALARLAHPNVVPIFDVGTHEGQIFLVMELVEGGTLRTWLEASPRSVRDVVRAYRDAGTGLAAAHRAGFIHRDFKPDNALIGSDDQRVRVVDFGLVHENGEARAGLGTPRYMPPEQAAGGTLTPAADQYAFCASLREAVRARNDNTDAIPRWLDDILARGLAREPEARWPSMAALLDALALDPAARWRRRGIVAAVVALGAVAFVVGRAQGESLPDCDGGASELAQVWSPSLRDVLAAKLVALGTPYAKQAAPALVETLDGYAQALRTGHLDACKAHRRGAQSDALFDRRMRCLDEARAALAAAATVAGDAKAEGLAQVVVATRDLPALERCGDEVLLSISVAPPPATKRIDVGMIERELAAREVDVRAGRDDVDRPIDALVARARAVAYRPVLAKALRLRGVAAILRGNRKQAIEPLGEATHLALSVGDLELGVEAYARRAWAQATYGDKDDRSEPLAGLGMVEALATSLPEPAHATRVLLANNLGGIELARGDRARARMFLQRAFAEHGATTGPMATELAQVPTNYALALDDETRRDQLFASARARLTTLLGPNHPVTLANASVAATRISDDELARQAFEEVCTALLAFHPSRGRAIRECALELAWIALARDDEPAQRRWLAALVDAEARGGSKETGALARAHLLRLHGEPSQSARAFAAQQAGLDAPDRWWKVLPVADTELGIALAEQAFGDMILAAASFERARATLLPIRAFYPGPIDRRLRFIAARAGSP